MASSIISPIPPPPVVKSERRRRHRSADREETPTAANPESNSTMALAPVPDLAAIFKSDLTNIRSLVTCSICDQLLYEPWTLGCGHTYCYSCLCSWFVPNKRKKTCPECRSRVKQLPAPNFLVKQMVDIFTKRVELMPADESIEQHNAKRAEEIADVEKDKNGPDGLFKGTFPGRETQLMFDEEDGVLRCPHCAHEHEGGPSCLNCGAEIDDDRDGFSDMEDDDLDADLEELELDFDRELGAELGLGAHDNFFADLPRVPMGRGGHLRFTDAAHHFLHHRRGPRVESSELSTSESEIDSEADEDEGSLQDFVVQDEDEPPRPMGRVGARNRQVITILSDDDSDEGGEISSRRPRRRNLAANLSSPSTLTVTDDSTNGSEAGDMHSEADRLRTAGWSPLDPGTDSDPDVPNSYQERYGYGSTLDGNDSDEDSDTNTETMVGAIPTDDEDEGLRDDMSETPTYDGPNPYHAEFRRYGQDVYEHLGEDDSDDDSDALPRVITDHDGDTEMSASPDARRSTSVSTNPYRNDSESRSSRQPSVSTNYDFDDGSNARDSRGPSVSTNGEGNNYQYRPENLGAATQVHDVQDDSSDASIRPPVRRRRPRYNLDARVQQYDPRISRLFADHQQTQQTGQGSRDHPVELEELDEWTQSDVRRVVEPASRNRRMTAYRSMPARRADALRSSRSPSATSVIASTNRGTRPPRRNGRERSYN